MHRSETTFDNLIDCFLYLTGVAGRENFVKLLFFRVQNFGAMSL
jgi:hypothetical protein